MQALTLIEVLRHRSSMDRVGVTFIEGGSKEKFLSYREVYERASRTLKTLQQRGLQAGNELVFQIEDNETFVNVFWACILGGIIPVPLSIGHKVDHKKKLFNVWQVLNDPFLIANGDHLSKLDEFVQKAQLDGVLDTMSERFIALESLSPADQPGKIHSADPDDIAFIQFSSGSTGQPKGVVLTHRNLITNIRAIAAAAKYAPDDATLGWMPLTHDMGMIGFHINPLFSGMSQFLMPTSLFVRRPALWLDKTSAHKVTVTCSPNFGYKYLMKHVPDSDAQDWDLSSVRVLYNGAEPISEDLCHKFLDRMAIHGLKKTAMCPVYGLAEATLAVSVSVLDAEVRSCRVLREELKVGEEIVLSNDPEESVAFVNVGTAVDDCSIRIIDERGLRVPEGIVGYLKIKGPNVTAGYYNNDAESQRVIDEDQWLNTGDLAFIKDGDLFITGRAKDIIFVNGQNYYPHDIEDIACELDGIDLNKIALGGYFNEKLQREETFAFIFHRAKLEAFIPLAKAVKALVNSKVGFELDRVLPVKSLPKTTSGKLQRYRLLQDYRKGKFQKVEEELNELEAKLRKRAMSIVAPKNKREKKMLKIWQKVLNFKDFGVTDKFFEIGGNSLKAAEIGMSVLREFQVEIPLEWLHSKECIREMVAALKSLEKQVYKPLPKNIQATNVNIAPAQKRLYYSWEMNRNAVAYNTPIALRIGGVKLAADRLEQCIAQLLERHESLRTSFHLNDDQVQFSIAEKVDFQLTQMNCPKEELDKRLRALVQPFDLQKAPLFRVALLQINHYEQVLFADFHHIISDGVSIHTFLNELVNLYIGKTLPPLSANYRDYAAWMNGQLTEEAMLEKENYWLELLSGELPVLDLPLDFQRPAVFDTKGAKLSKSLGRKLSNQLRELARQSDSSLHSLLFTAYQILLAKYTGQNEQLIGIPVAGRIHPDLQDIQGMFVNNLTLRNTTDGNESFMALLKK
ncbi:MAG: condensation domain-containing protein [Bacteroidota bacterium]